MKTEDKIIQNVFIYDYGITYAYSYRIRPEDNLRILEDK